MILCTLHLRARCVRPLLRACRPSIGQHTVHHCSRHTCQPRISDPLLFRLRTCRRTQRCILLYHVASCSGMVLSTHPQIFLLKTLSGSEVREKQALMQGSRKRDRAGGERQRHASFSASARSPRAGRLLPHPRTTEGTGLEQQAERRQNVVQGAVQPPPLTFAGSRQRCESQLTRTRNRTEDGSHRKRRQRRRRQA